MYKYSQLAKKTSEAALDILISENGILIAYKRKLFV